MKISLENSVMFKTSSSEIAHYGKSSIAVLTRLLLELIKTFISGEGLSTR